MMYIKLFENYNKEDILDYFIDFEDDGWIINISNKEGEPISILTRSPFSELDSKLRKYQAVGIVEKEMKKSLERMCKISKKIISDRKSFSFKIRVSTDMGLYRNWDWKSGYIENTPEYLGFRENAGKLIPRINIIASDAIYNNFGTKSPGDNYEYVINVLCKIT